jgi:DNA-binding XRE family transcriptional regulator
MNPFGRKSVMAKDQLAAKIPVYEEGKVSFAKLRALLEVSNEDIAQIIDVSPTTVREGNVSEKTLKKAQPLLYVLNMLWQIMEGDIPETRRWLKEPRVEWMGLTPIDCLSMGKSKAVIEFLQRNIEGEMSGS